MTSTVPIHGNYRGYYTKRPAALSEPRLSRLPAGLFRNATVLDVGCNEGWITCEIAQSWGASKVVGVDIDETLIQGAWRRRRTLWSLQEPGAAAAGPAESPTGATAVESKDQGKRKRDDHGGGRSRAAVGTTTPESSDGLVQAASILAAGPRRNYFPLSCEHEFGSLPVPPHELHGADGRGRTVFPHNVVFRTADWTEGEIVEDSDGYDVVLAFSISKWIHLNSGDAGLRRFFEKIYRVLRKGGTFVLEPQPWESYAKARRMSEKLKETCKTLELRPDEFERVLREIGFGPAQHMGSTGEGGFDRPIDVYVKR